MEKEQLKWFVFTSLISADYEGLTEDTKQDILHRYNENRDFPNWGYVLEPIEDISKRNKLIDLLQECDK